MNANDILREALSLPADDRAKIASELLDSLGDDAPTDAEWRSAWLPELEHRVQSLTDGSEEAIPADQVFAELDAHLGEIRRAG